MDKLLSRTYTRKELITAGLVASGSILVLALSKRYFNGGTCTITKDLTGQVVVITGANTGIGKETARELARMGATIVIGSRDPQRTLPVVDELKADTKNPNIEFIQLDLADLSSVREFANKFKAKYNRLNILINNAAIMALVKRDVTKDGFEAQLGVNHLGHFYLTELLLDVIKASTPSRIINVSSHEQGHGVIAWDDLMSLKKYSPPGAYRQSKLAILMVTRELQRRMDLEKANVKVVSLHPGFVRTELTRYLREKMFFKTLWIVFYPLLYLTGKSPLQGAQTTLYCALEDQSKLKGGAYYADCEEGRINPLALDDEGCKRLWTVSQNLIAEKI